MPCPGASTSRASISRVTNSQLGAGRCTFMRLVTPAWNLSPQQWMNMGRIEVRHLSSLAQLLSRRLRTHEFQTQWKIFEKGQNKDYSWKPQHWKQTPQACFPSWISGQWWQWWLEQYPLRQETGGSSQVRQSDTRSKTYTHQYHGVSNKMTRS